MIRLNARFDDAVYDDATDVMFFRLGNAPFSDEEEVCPGIHLLYAYDTKRRSEIIGVEIEGFRRRYGPNPSSIDLSPKYPLELALA